MPHHLQDLQPLQDNEVVEDLGAEDEHQEEIAEIAEIEEAVVEDRVKIEGEAEDEEDMHRRMATNLHLREHHQPIFEAEALSVVG